LFDSIRPLFKRLAPAVDFCSLRVLDESSAQITVRQDVLQPLSTRVDHGALVTIIHRGGYGYAATSDLSTAGLKEAIAQAQTWAAACAGRSVTDYSKIAMPRANGRYHSPRSAIAPQRSRREIIELLQAESATCRIDDRIVDWHVSLWTMATEQLYLTTDGGDIEQQFRYVMPILYVTAPRRFRHPDPKLRRSRLVPAGRSVDLSRRRFARQRSTSGRRITGIVDSAQLPEWQHGFAADADPDDAANS